MKAAGRPKKQPISQLRSLGERGFGLTDKQEQFALIYATHGVTPTEAAKMSGYGKQSCVSCSTITGAGAYMGSGPWTKDRGR